MGNFKSEFKNHTYPMKRLSLAVLLLITPGMALTMFDDGVKAVNATNQAAPDATIQAAPVAPIALA